MRRIPSNLFVLLAILALSGCKADSSDSSSRPTPPSVPSAMCADGIDNDSDGLVDFPDDPGCSNAADNNETDLVVIPECSDGLDNDNDGLTDFPDDPSCVAEDDNSEVDPLLNRYEMANSCWIMRANGNGQYVAFAGSAYKASAANYSDAERFYMKPTALGKYMFYNSNRQLMTAGDATLSNVSSANATDDSEWYIRAVGDSTDYPETPTYNREPIVNDTVNEVAAWRNFDNNPVKAGEFNVTAQSLNRSLAIDSSGNLITEISDSSVANESFSFVEMPQEECKIFPEGESNFSGEPFKGKRADNTVLGHADAHVHISATEFLGGAHWGYPFHKFGIEHALGDCNEEHGDNGQFDLVGGVFTGEPEHGTDGWPTFSDWPSRGNLTHEAIYWKWIERAWAGGLRVVVNDLVDNETLCELQRNAVTDPNAVTDFPLDCNSMNNAGRQAGTMYAMENYIDAQYGGPGKGFFQIVHSPEEARAVIEDGKIAVVLGIEISNLFDCKVNYNPLRVQEPFEETGEGFSQGAAENSYGCTEESIAEGIDRIHNWGVRQVISIHEFDNAFGGNGIFDGLILNLGNRENSGGIPSGDLASIISLITGPDASQLQTFLENLSTTELATGEFWTTYDCPIEGVTTGFSGYLWENAGGSRQFSESPLPEPFDGVTIELPVCVPTGQDGRAGGAVPCYPAGINQCNARWMTPIGLYTYRKMMEKGFLIDWDHIELGMKTQLLELAEAQVPVYPFVSTHGTFGGTSNSQAKRLLANGGYLYPSNSTSGGFLANMNETFGIYEEAMVLRAQKGLEPILFGFGYGTDTNGLSAQSSGRGENLPDERKVVYPFRFYSNGRFSQLSEFSGVEEVTFSQPASSDEAEQQVRVWNEDTDGNAHYGMLSDFVQEIVIDGSADAEQLRHLFNSAEAYLQTWERTEAARASIELNGQTRSPGAGAPSILRRAPIGPIDEPGEFFE